MPIGGDAINRELNLYLVVLLDLLACLAETFSFGSASYSGCLVMPNPKLPDTGLLSGPKYCQRTENQIDKRTENQIDKRTDLSI